MQEHYGANPGPDAENLLPGDNGGGGATGNVPNTPGFWNVDLDADEQQQQQPEARDRGKQSNSNNIFNVLLVESSTSRWGNFKRKWFRGGTVGTESLALFMEFSPLLQSFYQETVPEITYEGVMVFDGRKFALDELALLLDMLPIEQRDPFRLHHPDDPLFYQYFQPESRMYKMMCPCPSRNRNDVFLLDDPNDVVYALKLAVSRLGCAFLVEQLQDPVFDLAEAGKLLVLRELARIQLTNPILARCYIREKAEFAARRNGHRSLLASPSPVAKKAKVASPVPAKNARPTSPAPKNARPTSPAPKEERPTSPMPRPGSCTSEYPTSQDSATEAEMAYQSNFVRVKFVEKKKIN